jgi:hypothetical protein
MYVKHKLSPMPIKMDRLDLLKPVMNKKMYELLAAKAAELGAKNEQKA